MDALIREITDLPSVRTYGRVVGVRGLMIEIAGPVHVLGVGSRMIIEAGPGRRVPVEVVGFDAGRALCLPFASVEGVRMGCPAYLESLDATVHPSKHWLGRVINAFGDPIDRKGPLQKGPTPMHLRAAPPPASDRRRVGPPVDLGVRVMNAFVTCCEGQRMGIFAGSGVGKSVLLSMMARHTSADISVIGLIGERGREVQEFIEDDLGEDGLARSVIIVATSDESALMRRQAAYLTMTVAEYFRQEGQNVLCLMDSVTRFAMAQREIGLSAGEPPTSKGYTPTVFAELPRLLERAGPGRQDEGSVTGLFTVLVDGDNHNEPVADAVRGILDGHVVMERAIAERGRYPAVNVLKSVSRTMPRATPEAFRPVIREARRLMAIYADMEELIRLGAYRAGSNPEVDRAIALNGAFEDFLTQGKDESTSIGECYTRLIHILETSGQPFGNG